MVSVEHRSVQMKETKRVRRIAVANNCGANTARSAYGGWASKTHKRYYHNLGNCKENSTNNKPSTGHDIWFLTYAHVCVSGLCSKASVSSEMRLGYSQAQGSPRTIPLPQGRVSGSAWRKATQSLRIVSNNPENVAPVFVASKWAEIDRTAGGCAALWGITCLAW